MLCRATLLDAFTLNGQNYQPDLTKGYLEASLSHTVPVFTYYGEGLAPATVRNSFASMLHQPVNREHRLRAFDPDHRTPDAIVGCVVASEFSANAALPRRLEDAPGIRAVASLFKLADGVDKILGQHQAGRQTFTVSMEVFYSNTESGFIMPIADDDDPKWTPEEWRAAGWNYVPYPEADEILLSTRDWKRSRMASWRADGRGYCGKFRREGGPERECYWLMGGLNGQVHYSGFGLVKAGAEPTAQITQMLAHSPELEALEELRASWTSALSASGQSNP